MQNVFNFYVKRNSSGYVVQISGVGGRMLEWLSLYHNFTFELFYFIAFKILILEWN